MTLKVRVLLVSILCACCIFTLSAVSFAATNMGYYDREVEPNDTIARADTITSERVMQGRFDSTSDNDDYFSLGSLASGTTIYAQLNQIYSSCDYDLSVVNSSGTLLQGSSNSGDKGEMLTTTTSSSGTYYIRVHRFSGTSTTYYRLYTQTSGQSFNQSFYITNVSNDTAMYKLGRDWSNNLPGLVFLSFGAMEKRSGSYGIRDLNGNWADTSRVKTAIEKFIQGYNDNPRHTASIQLVIGLNNKPSPTSAYRLAGTIAEYSAHGATWKSMLNSVSLSGYVSDIHGGIDAELDWNTASLTRAWVDGFTSASGFKRMYNFGDHAGVTTDFSSQTDPVFNNNWKASDIHYISWGNSAAYCVPQIYVSGMANQWTYQKKWSYLSFSGVMSTNGWDGLYTNQQSYNAFNNKLTAEGLSQSLNNRTWIVLSPPANPN